MKVQCFPRLDPQTTSYGPVQVLSGLLSSSWHPSEAVTTEQPHFTTGETEAEGRSLALKVVQLSDSQAGGHGSHTCTRHGGVTSRVRRAAPGRTHVREQAVCGRGWEPLGTGAGSCL